MSSVTFKDWLPFGPVAVMVTGTVPAPVKGEVDIDSPKKPRPFPVEKTFTLAPDGNPATAKLMGGRTPPGALSWTLKKAESPALISTVSGEAARKNPAAGLEGATVNGILVMLCPPASMPSTVSE